MVDIHYICGNIAATDRSFGGGNCTTQYATEYRPK